MKLESIYSPAFRLSRYKVDATRESATLADVGLNYVIIPLNMLRDHVESNEIRITNTLVDNDDNGMGRTRPATEANLTESEMETMHVSNECNGDDEIDLESGPEVTGSDVNSYELTTEDI